MVEITKLTHPDNVTLMAGATQYWQDPSHGVGWEDAVVRQVSGRTIVIGRPGDALLAALDTAAEELHLVVRGIPDAAALGTALPQAHVWCGDVADVPVADFDTVIALADASEILPLESESRSWQEVTDSVIALGKADAKTLLLIEGDLGAHRLANKPNPLAADQETDWDPTRTWDKTRPRTLRAVRQLFPSAQVWSLWPHPVEVSLIASADLPQETFNRYASHATLLPLVGADPSWLVAGFASAGSLVDISPAWFVALNGVAPQRTELVTDTGLVELPEDEVEGESALLILAKLCSAQDLPSMRKLVSAWASATASGEKNASFGLCSAITTDEGWEISPLIAKASSTSAEEEQLRAIGELVAGMVNRGWRRPWPATAAPVRIVNHLALMAGLHPVSEARAKKLVQVATVTDLVSSNAQSLEAVLAHQTREIDTLRSKLAWTNLMWEQDRLRPASAPVALVRATKKSFASKATKAVRAIAKRLT